MQSLHFCHFHSTCMSKSNISKRINSVCHHTKELFTGIIHYCYVLTIYFCSALVLYQDKSPVWLLKYMAIVFLWSLSSFKDALLNLNVIYFMRIFVSTFLSSFGSYSSSINYLRALHFGIGPSTEVGTHRVYISWFLQ